MKDGTLRIRCTAEELAGWRRAAYPESLSTYVRRALRAYADALEPSGPPPSPFDDALGFAAPFPDARKGISSTLSDARKGMCEHRISAGSFCKVCDG
jgi:hypothetical protein